MYKKLLYKARAKEHANAMLRDARLFIPPDSVTPEHPGFFFDRRLYIGY